MITLIFLYFNLVQGVLNSKILESLAQPHKSQTRVYEKVNQIFVMIVNLKKKNIIRFVLFMITYKNLINGFLWVTFSINTDKIWSTPPPRSLQNKNSLTSEILISKKF